jgi:hypothetical protein
MNKRGVVLIICYMVIALLSTLAGAFLIRSVSERSVASNYFGSTQAFWLSEAGVNQGISQLHNDWSNLTTIPRTSLGQVGNYSATINSSGSTTRIVTASGFFPSSNITRVIEVNVTEIIPPDFYGNAIYAAGNVTIGSNCVVKGDAFSGGTVTGPVTGNTTQNNSTLHNDGLALLNFDTLKNMSIQQGWYNNITNTTTYPTTSFWYQAPSGNSSGIPNVVFVDGDFTLVGGKQVVCGFIVVGGNTIYDAEIGGNARIDGCLYTRGNIDLHGGGGKIINVDGGLWAGGTISMVGNEEIDFNPPGNGTNYTAAIQGCTAVQPDVHVTSWRETQNPY